MKSYRQLFLLSLMLSCAIPAFALSKINVRLSVLASNFKSDINAFHSFLPPVYDQGNYAFVGFQHGATQLAIYTNINGYLQDIVTNNTPLPGGAGPFVDFGGQNNSGSHVLSLSPTALTFEGNGRFQQTGLYIYKQKQLHLIANQNTPIPATSGTFSSFQDPNLLSDNSVVFIGKNHQGNAGIYLANPQGLLKKLLDSNTALPLGKGTFDTLSHLSASPNSTDTAVHFAFVGKGSGNQLGLYRYTNGQFQLLANENTSIPGEGTGFFQHFDSVSYDQATHGVAYIGGGVLGQTGVYYNNGKENMMIANTQTFIPDGIGHFTKFSELSTSGQSIIFHGDGQSGQKGVYVYDSQGGIYKILSTHDKINGKTIQNVMISKESLSGNNVALWVQFKNDDKALYFATFFLSNQ